MSPITADLDSDAPISPRGRSSSHAPPQAGTSKPLRPICSGGCRPVRRDPFRIAATRVPLLGFLCILQLLPIGSANAQKHWIRSVGGDYNEQGFSIVERSAQDGFLLTGWTTSWGPGSPDYSNTFVMRVDEFGDVLWKRSLGDTYNETAYAIVETKPDRGSIVCATRTIMGSNDDAVAYRLDEAGNLLWERKYGGPWMENARCARQSREGFVLGGARSIGMYGAADMYAVWLNEQGDTLRTRHYGGDAPDWAEAVETTADGGILLGGNTFSYGAGGADWYLVKTDRRGDLVWDRAYGTSRHEILHAMCRVRTGGYIAVGSGYAPGSNQVDILMIRLADDGEVIWWKYFGTGAAEEGYSVCEAVDGGLIACGLTLSVGPYQSLYVIRVDASGALEWERAYGGNGSDIGYSVSPVRDGGVIAAGSTTSSGPGSQIYMVRTDARGLVSDPPALDERCPIAALPAPSPNPFRESTSLRGREGEAFDIYDSMGRQLKRTRGNRIGDGLPPGVYFLRPSNGDGGPMRIVKLP